MVQTDNIQSMNVKVFSSANPEQWEAGQYSSRPAPCLFLKLIEMNSETLSLL
jgi:hypothetical protein